MGRRIVQGISPETCCLGFGAVFFVIAIVLSPKTCVVCEDAFVDIDGMCAKCAIQHALDNDHKQRAYDLASDFGYPESTVRRLLRDTNERRVAAETAAAIKAGMAPRLAPVVRATTRATNAAIRDMLSAVALLDAPANDVAPKAVA